MRARALEVWAPRFSKGEDFDFQSWLDVGPPGAISDLEVACLFLGCVQNLQKPPFMPSRVQKNRTAKTPSDLSCASFADEIQAVWRWTLTLV